MKGVKSQGNKLKEKKEKGVVILEKFLL